MTRFDSAGFALSNGVSIISEHRLLPEKSAPEVGHFGPKIHFSAMLMTIRQVFSTNGRITTNGRISTIGRKNLENQAFLPDFFRIREFEIDFVKRNGKFQKME